MWKFLYQIASPRSFFSTTQPYIFWIGLLALGCLLIGISWGLFFAPADYQQGEAFRIIYIHVPAAFMSLTIYAALTFAALLLLVWGIKLAGYLLVILAKIGAIMTLLALITGSIWGKPMWGAWWVWDSRLTSELILLFIYLALIALGSSFKSKQQSDKMVAILALIGTVDLPIIHYSVYWWNTLHQGATLSFFSKPKIALPMLYPLILTLLGFVFYSLWIILHQVGEEILEREKRQTWVKALFREKIRESA